jgi:tetratricopeptide (TPR) repeat protein
LSFQVITGGDLPLAGMQEVIQKFVAAIRAGDIVFIYYAGHGMQVNGENLLVPVDFSAPVESQAANACIKFDDLQRRVESSSARLSVFVVDACRNNPYRRGREWGKGLAMAEAGLGSYIAFSASPGQTADDNPDERNGLFTKFLLRGLTEPPPLSQVFRNVRDSVWVASQERQRPFIHDQIIGDFLFVPDKPVAQSATESPDVEQLLEEGKRLFHAAKCTESLERFDRAIRLVPANPFAQNAAGVALSCQNRQSEAIQRFSMALRLQPNMASAYLNRGMVYANSGQYDLAIEDFTWAVEQEPANATYYVRRGKAYFNIRKYQEAVGDFTRAIMLNDADAEAYCGRGRVRQRLGDYAQALGDFDLALARNNNLPEALRGRSQVLERVKK